VNTSI